VRNLTGQAPVRLDPDAPILNFWPLRPN
jgi:hypothetical protein